MTHFSAKSNRVLGAMAFLCLIALLSVELGKQSIEQQWFKDKSHAANLAKMAMNHLKQIQLKNGVFIDAVNDPNETTLIGQEYSLITTETGSHESKLLSVNPNYAAVIIDMLKSAGLHKGDYVAIGMTGSFPGLNISALAALQTLGLKALMITSVGASNWGATDPQFTWLDMERELYNANIFVHRSLAASIGGGLDKGQGLSPQGRDLVLAAIKRNNIKLIHHEFLHHSITDRMNHYYSNAEGNKISAYINIGGGIASMGHPLNKHLIPPGLSIRLPERNYPSHGIMNKMAATGIPVIQLHDLKSLHQQYGLTEEPALMMQTGLGDVFVKRGYNPLLCILCLLILVGCIAFIYWMDKRQHVLGHDKVNVKTVTDPPENNVYTPTVTEQIY